MMYVLLCQPQSVQKHLLPACLSYYQPVQLVRCGHVLPVTAELKD